MTLVMGFCSKDYAQAARFFEWSASLGREDAHECVLVAAKATTQEQRMPVVIQARTAFKKVTLITPIIVDERGWPWSCNVLWRTAVHYVAKNRLGHWLWVEPDVVPIRAGWIGAIDREYRRRQQPYLGAISEYHGRHMTGVGVYPEDITRFNRDPLGETNRPWDLVSPKKTLAHFAESTLIQHVWGDVQKNIAPTFPDKDSLSILSPTAVLFHRCKDGSLIDQLRLIKNETKAPAQDTVKSATETSIAWVVTTLLSRWRKNIPSLESDKPAIVQLGKIGDILNVLPIARFMHTICHYKPIPMVIHQAYLKVVKRCTYVEPITWKGEVHEREKAAELAARYSGNVMVPQLFNSNGSDPNTWKTKHFNLDQWERCGLLDFFELFPLEIDNRDWAEEEKLLHKLKRTEKPLLCYNLDAGSAPFGHKDLIVSAISKRFGDCEILDLGSLRNEVAYTDLLGILAECHVLVTADTATLHLAQASHCPYIPLISTHCNGWLSSAVRRAPVFTLRYDEVETRIDELIEAIAKCVGKTWDQGQLLHCVSRRTTEDERIARAEFSWNRMYCSNQMIPVHVWNTKRSAKEIMGDKRDLPFLKDVIDVALVQAKDNDIIVFTNDDVVLTDDTLNQIKLKLRYVNMVVGSRLDVKSKINGKIRHSNILVGSRHPGRDLVAWNTGWLRKNRDLIPDFILGSSEWDIALAAIARKQAGLKSCMENLNMMFPECELSPGTLFHERHDPYWATKENYSTAPSQIHNQTLAEEWFRANMPEMQIGWFKRT